MQKAKKKKKQVLYKQIAPKNKLKLPHLPHFPKAPSWRWPITVKCEVVKFDQEWFLRFMWLFHLYVITIWKASHKRLYRYIGVNREPKRKGSGFYWS